MRIRLAIPDQHISPEILDAVLEATTRANQSLIASGETPLVEELIRGGARWKPEPYTDGEHFDLGPEIAMRSWGDCDDWAPLLAAELRARGDHGARAFTKKSGPGRYHALVADGSGKVLDPSVWAGMRSQDGNRPSVCGPIACVGESAAAVVPWGPGWAGRVDLPFGARHLSARALSATPELALWHAMDRAGLLGQAAGILTPEEVQGLGALVAGLTGDPEDPEVGSFLDSLTNMVPGAITSLPVVSTVVPVAKSLISSLTSSPGKSQVLTPQAYAPPPPPPAPPEGLSPQAFASAFPPTVATSAAKMVPTSAAQLPNGMHTVPLPGGGQMTYHPQAPGPIIVRF